MVGDMEVEVAQNIPDEPVVIGQVIGHFQLMAQPAERQPVLFIQLRKRIVRQRMKRQ
ncbi:modification methylase DdeI [Corchorus olitorius]|uniref:Modification methylase DdeI n=1 Tax=Corchorus olitorius TaxID=93759 RepID=A0A1R3L121_9ROSI|nr:modification methylase DdeI [Corchorus olitorius]